MQGAAASRGTCKTTFCICRKNPSTRRLASNQIRLGAAPGRNCANHLLSALASSRRGRCPCGRPVHSSKAGPGPFDAPSAIISASLIAAPQLPKYRRPADSKSPASSRICWWSHDFPERIRSTMSASIFSLLHFDPASGRGGPNSAAASARAQLRKAEMALHTNV